MAQKLKAEIGAYIGFINPNRGGRLLLVRRTQTESIIPGQSFRGNWELPGGAVEETEESSIRYDLMTQTALAKANLKVGIYVVGCQVFPFYTAFFKNPGTGGYDLAGVTPYISNLEPVIGETMWVSVEELNELATQFVSETDAKSQGLSEAKGLLSGYGKRMHCMALMTLTHGVNAFNKRIAQGTLAEIMAKW